MEPCGMKIVPFFLMLCAKCAGDRLREALLSTTCAFMKNKLQYAYTISRLMGVLRPPT